MKKVLLNKMRNLLDEYEYDYNDYALEKIIDTWYENKEGLRQILSKHPNWNEDEQAVIFDIDVNREINGDAIEEFYWWLRDNFQKIFYLPQKTLLEEEDVEKIKERYPEFKGVAGQKVSRAMNKLFCQFGIDKHEDYNREFAKFADAVNPLKITRHTVISINLLDYLTMSFGNSWASCHTIDKTNRRHMPNNYQGCYSSGTLSYGLDHTSMVFYTVDASFNGTDYYLQPKINRQMFHYENEKLIQGRLYPQSCDYGSCDSYTMYRNIMQSIIALGLDVPNRWDLKKGTEPCRRWTESYGTHYRDYLNFENCTLSILKDSENDETVYIGRRPICIECGEVHSTEDNINCCATHYVYCEDCGCRIYEDAAIYVDGDYYCSDCVTYCEDCERYHRNDDVRYVESVNRYVCDNCLDYYYRYCEDCHEYYPEDECTYLESEYGYVTNEYLNEHYECCEECGEYHKKEEMTFVESAHGYVCEDCLCDKYAFCEECGAYYKLSDCKYVKNAGYVCEDCYDYKYSDEEEECDENEAV